MFAIKPNRARTHAMNLPFAGVAGHARQTHKLHIGSFSGAQNAALQINIAIGVNLEHSNFMPVFPRKNQLAFQPSVLVQILKLEAIK